MESTVLSRVVNAQLIISNMVYHHNRLEEMLTSERWLHSLIDPGGYVTIPQVRNRIHSPTGWLFCFQCSFSWLYFMGIHSSIVTLWNDTFFISSVRHWNWTVKFSKIPKVVPEFSNFIWHNGPTGHKFSISSASSPHWCCGRDLCYCWH